MHDLALAGEPWDGDWYCRTCGVEIEYAADARHGSCRAPVTAIERLWGVARVLRFQVRARGRA